MIDSEWEDWLGLLEATFSGELTPDREAALRRYFGPVPAEMAARVVDLLVKRGQVHMPVPGEAMRALRVVAGGEWGLKVALSGPSSDELAARLNGLNEQALAHGRRQIGSGS